MEFDSQIEKLLQGDIRTLARLISLVEDRSPGHGELIDAIYPQTHNAYRIGITGPPGAGKSTLVDKLVPYFRRDNKRVAVIACDPTSPFSGGALLGDRVRMQSLLTDDGVFIRSVATRGSLGGLSRMTHEVALLLEAAQFDVVMFETIGVGQAEIDIMQTADSVAVVVIPQSGDAVQAIKAGLMEIADVFVLNKADQGQVDRAVQALHLALPGVEETERWVAPIVKTIASTGEGLADLKAGLDKHREFLGIEGLRQKRRSRLELFLQRIIEDAIREELWNPERSSSLNSKVDAILDGKSGPYSVARDVQKQLEL